jgi:hypothetical protein
LTTIKKPLFQSDLSAPDWTRTSGTRFRKTALGILQGADIILKTGSELGFEPVLCFGYIRYFPFF